MLVNEQTMSAVMKNAQLRMTSPIRSELFHKLTLKALPTSIVRNLCLSIASMALCMQFLTRNLMKKAKIAENNSNFQKCS